jgi:hypothetical protein
MERLVSAIAAVPAHQRVVLGLLRSAAIQCRKYISNNGGRGLVTVAYCILWDSEANLVSASPVYSHRQARR